MATFTSVARGRRVGAYNSSVANDILPNESDDENTLDNEESVQRLFTRAKPRDLSFTDRRRALNQQIDEKQVRASRAVSVKLATEKQDGATAPPMPPLSDEESVPYIRQRVEGFMARAGLCEQVSVRTLQKNQDSSLNAIVNYVKHALASDDAYFGIVPTAWIITGAVGFDSAVTFSLLLDRIQENKRTFIAPVSSADAATPGKLFKAFARSLLDPNSVGRKITFEDLREWSAQQSPRPKIVLAIEDSEQFDPQILVNFLALVCKHARELQIVIVVGVTASLSTLQSQLPRSLLGQMSRDTFKIAASTNAIDTVMTEIFLDGKLGFDIGPNVFKFLDTFFTNYSNSLQQFAGKVRFTIHDYFMKHIFSWVAHKASLTIERSGDSTDTNFQERLAEIFRDLSEQPWLEQHVMATLFRLDQQKGKDSYGDNAFPEIAAVIGEGSMPEWIAQQGPVAVLWRAERNLAARFYIASTKLLKPHKTLSELFLDILEHREDAIKINLKEMSQMGLFDTINSLQFWIQMLSSIHGFEDSVKAVMSLVGPLQQARDDAIARQVSLDERHDIAERLMFTHQWMQKYLHQRLLAQHRNVLADIIFYFDDVQALKDAFMPDLHSDIKKEYMSMLRQLRDKGIGVSSSSSSSAASGKRAAAPRRSTRK